MNEDVVQGTGSRPNGPPGAGEPSARQVVPPDAPLPQLTTALIANPNAFALISLSSSMHQMGIGTVLQAESVEEVDEVMTEGRTGDVAVISLRFGPSAQRLIHDLGQAGWPRVLASSSTADLDPVIAAIRAGACGLVRGPPAVHAIPDPAAVHELTDDEIAVLRLVANGSSNEKIGRQLSLSTLTVKSHLARIGRRLGTGDRAHMVIIGLRYGLIR